VVSGNVRVNVGGREKGRGRRMDERQGYWKRSKAWGWIIEDGGEDITERVWDDGGIVKRWDRDRGKERRPNGRKRELSMIGINGRKGRGIGVGWEEGVEK